MKRKNTSPETSCRLNRVGGQAVLEGVMMKAGNRTVTTCRKDDGSIAVYDDSFVSVRKKHKILNLPILRGVVNFIEMMKLSMKTLNASADALGIEEEEGKFEKWCKKHLGAKSTDVIMAISLILGLALSVLLFIYLPTASANGINWLWVNAFRLPPLSPTVIAIIEGFMKVVIFIAYLVLVSLMKDIKRTFMYHGAEHKTIACFEAGEELTPENAMKHKRFHPRCGTSFMFLMIAIGIVIGIFVRHALPPEEAFAYSWLYTLTVSGTKILLLPLTMGIGYEILMLAGKHDNVLTRIISAPGLWVQRITTKEPTADMLEIAIISTKCALRDDFPEYMEFWKERSWETKPETDAQDTADSVSADVAAEPVAEAENTADSVLADAAAEPVAEAENTADSVTVTATDSEPTESKEGA